MYLDEVPEGQVRDDLALIIEEVIRQRMKGVQNEKGVWITPAFPKLIYVLDEDNITEDSKYWYLTKLAAKCTAKRMVPDYISAKKMKEYKGDVYPAMGCVEGSETIGYSYKSFQNEKASMEHVWTLFSNIFEVKKQPNGKDEYIDLEDVYVNDMKEGKKVKAFRIIRNKSSEWVQVKLSSGHMLTCTLDHPFHILQNSEDLLGGWTPAGDLRLGDIAYVKGQDGKMTTAEVTGLTTAKIGKQYSYDLTTESEHFDISGIYTHNCRSFLTPDRSYKVGNIAKAKNFKEGQKKYYGRFNCGK